MKIGFDAKRAAQNRTGLGNYSRFVLHLLEQYAPADEYLLYTPNPKKCRLLPALPKNFSVRFPAAAVWKRFRALWRVWGVTHDLMRDGVQLFHGLSNELPLNIRRAKNVKSVVTIHDLIFLRYPSCYPLIDRTIYNYKFRKACRNADRIIAVSECTKRDIVSLYHISPDKIDVIYQGCDPQFRLPASEEMKQQVRTKYALPSRYILYVGSIERRKNLLLLAQALRQLDAGYQVVAVGKHTPYADEVAAYLQRHGLSRRMQFLHGVPFDELPALYQLATVFVYPSRYEGFGIPLLEALCSGTPAIGAHGSCLEEAGGLSSLYVSPDDDSALADAIRCVYTDESLRTRMVEGGKQYAARFTDEPLAQQLLEVYRKAQATN